MQFRFRCYPTPEPAPAGSPPCNRARFGWPAKLEPDQVALADHLMGEGTPVRATARMLNVCAAPVYRAMAASSSKEAEPSVRA